MIPKSRFSLRSTVYNADITFYNTYVCRIQRRYRNKSVHIYYCFDISNSLLYSKRIIDNSYESTALEDGLKTDHDSNDVDDDIHKEVSISNSDSSSNKDSSTGGKKSKKGSSEMGSIAEENEIENDDLLDPISAGEPEGMAEATTGTNSGNSNYKGYSSASQDPLIKLQETQRLQREVAAAIQRAETITESYQDIKVA